MNHRTGLYAAVLIKDNHLVLSAQQGMTSATAVRQTRSFIQQALDPDEAAGMVVEVEVDTVEQLREVLDAEPDVALLDNMSTEQMSLCVELRNATAPRVQLEASGRINLDTVRDISQTGVERVSVGALTHSAVNFDVGLDWS